ncbi:hypothetical protein BT63DRAFT_476377 [Microthyrium microscopicum]|uniref:C2H2-type domain-containing protein n=1 Tax=Microthyrium microscopicum TaxID=703497 RepID=A0A6A6UNR5_9PEZI|nr:hypothetical protein BT63DRAFT_476377 [Microthyrium microscopicum]
MAYFNCDSCDRTFGSYQASAQHMNALDHWDPEYECDFCNKVFATQQSCNDHMESLGHWDEGYDCDTCIKTYSKESSCEEHMDQFGHREPQFECDLCDRKFTTMQGCVQHMDALYHHKPTFGCETCPRFFTTETGRNQHMDALGHRTPTYKCQTHIDTNHGGSQESLGLIVAPATGNKGRTPLAHILPGQQTKDQAELKKDFFGPDVTGFTSSEELLCTITSNTHYNTQSLEELRLADYARGCTPTTASTAELLDSLKEKVPGLIDCMDMMYNIIAIERHKRLSTEELRLADYSRNTKPMSSNGWQSMPFFKQKAPDASSVEEACNAITTSPSHNKVSDDEPRLADYARLASLTEVDGKDEVHSPPATALLATCSKSHEEESIEDKFLETESSEDEFVSCDNETTASVVATEAAEVVVTLESPVDAPKSVQTELAAVSAIDLELLKDNCQQKSHNETTESPTHPALYELPNRSWNGYTWQCFLCHWPFKTPYLLGKHLNSATHSKELHHCPKQTCTESFQTIPSLFEHLEQESCGSKRFDGIHKITGFATAI